MNYDDVKLEILPEWKRDSMHRVEAGAEWLDNNYPTWYLSIDPVLLDMADGSQCICGQVFEEMAASDGFVYFTTHFGGNVMADRYGFINHGYEWHDNDYNWHSTSGEEEYSFLAEEWLLQVAKRVANDGNTVGNTVREVL